MTARTVLAIALAFWPIASAHAYQPGIDVSSNQGTISWASVKNAGTKFAFAKATEGQNFVDSKFTTNFTGAKSAGVLIGPYHFARPDSGTTDPTDAAGEANDFVDAIQSYYTGTNLTLRPVLDFETLSGTANEKAFLSQWVRNFETVVQNRLGFTAIIYSNSNYAKNYFETDINQYPLWLADWTFSTRSPPPVPDSGIWSSVGWKFWQYNDNGTVSGISGLVDQDVYDGTMAQLAQWIPDYHAGDFDGNGVVDDRDYVLWRNSKGKTVNIGTGADGDLSGVIDDADYTIWRSNFGKTYTLSGAGLGSSQVPEPGSALILAIGLVALAVRRAVRAQA